MADRPAADRPAKETPAAIEALCGNCREAVEAGRIPPLLLVATFVFDFLCIHPFRDGNGRVSRLLTTLLLGQHGFAVSRYIWSRITTSGLPRCRA